MNPAEKPESDNWYRSDSDRLDLVVQLLGKLLKVTVFHLFLTNPEETRGGSLEYLLHVFLLTASVVISAAISYDDLQLAADSLALHFFCCGMWSLCMLAMERWTGDALPKDNIYFATFYLAKHVFTLSSAFLIQAECLGMPQYPDAKIAIEFGTAVFCMFVFLKCDVPFGSCRRRQLDACERTLKNLPTHKATVNPDKN